MSALIWLVCFVIGSLVIVAVLAALIYCSEKFCRWVAGLFGVKDEED